MKIKVLFYVVGVLCGIMMPFKDAKAVVGRLSPQDFNKMYYLASNGKVGILRNAVNRGLNIDSVNPNGDTGLCIAVKRNNYIAYNSFRMSGANPRHACTFRIYNRYQEFLNSTKTVRENMVIGNEDSLYYREEERNWWPWILGGLAIGGGVSAMSGGGGGSPVLPDNTILPTPVYDGLATLTESYTKYYNGGVTSNNLGLNASNPNAAVVVNKIKFLPNMIDNAQYLNSFIKVTGGGKYTNEVGGSIVLGDRVVGTSGDGAIGISVDKASKAHNEGYIKIEAFNGAIGMVASGDNSRIENNAETDANGKLNEASDNGKIDIIFRGDREGDTVIGMYADSQAHAVNNGMIYGTTTETPVLASASKTTQSVTDDSISVKLEIGDIGDIGGELGSGEEGSGEEGSGEEGGDSSEREDEEEQKETDIKANSGSIIGMALFDFYTGSDLSNKEVKATNNGVINLKAGYNEEAAASVSLVGMGSYIDDKFLQGNNNPLFAEKMVLDNNGDISLSYQGAYVVDSKALKLGKGGLIGMRADANAIATNKGNIAIDLTGTTYEAKKDVAVGMLSVHGAELKNSGAINIKNEATSEGITYGMLATKGDGAQTTIYKWRAPKITNNNIININASNSYAMASFAGGEITNNGVINLGIEQGESYYKDNFGMYAGGGTSSEEVKLINNGTINVNSKDSVAMQNDFAGSGILENNGTINVSHKATTLDPKSFISNVFKGNFSKAVNRGEINYKVGNSLGNVELPSGERDYFGFNVYDAFTPFASVVSLSVQSSIYNQEFDNTGSIIVGDVWNPYYDDVDYGGTYNTVGIRVSDGSTAFNRGVINLKKYEDDVVQFNSGMWIDNNAADESRAENYGTIIVGATNSIGIRNDSGLEAIGRNLGTICVGKCETTDENEDIGGDYSYGMSVTTKSAQIINGKKGAGNPDDKESLNGKSIIEVNGKSSVGMFVKDGRAINYGVIKLKNDSATAVQISGKGTFDNKGIIEHSAGLKDAVYYWLDGNAEKTFDDTFDINGYTLAKATADEGGAKIVFSKDFVANVYGSNANSVLAKGIGVGSEINNYGKVTVLDENTGVFVKEGALFNNDGNRTVFNVDGSGTETGKTVGIYGTDKDTTINNSTGATLNVSNGGTGILAERFAKVYNSGYINVKSGGVGIDISDIGEGIVTEATNSHVINVEDGGSYGVKGKDAKFVNSATIHVGANTQPGSSGVITGVYLDGGYFENTGIINAVSNHTGTVIGAYLKDMLETTGESQIKVEGNILVDGESAIGLYNEDSVFTNKARIDVNKGIGYWIQSRYINLFNSGEINVKKGIGINIVKGNLENNANIKTISNYDPDEEYSTIGVNIDGSMGFATFTNKGSINVDSGVGVFVSNGGVLTNESDITINDGIGIVVGQNGTAINETTGVIKVNNGIGIVVGENGRAINNGRIEYTSSSNSHKVDDEGSFVNNGAIECVDCEDREMGVASIGNIISLEDGGNFINKGVVKLENVDVNFDEGAEKGISYEIGKDGSYVADSFSGDVKVSEDIVKGGFDDVYINKDSFVGKNEGVVVSSKSYMFDAKTNVYDDVTDVELNRKSFEDLVEERDLASFFETNYKLANNENLFNSLKSAGDKKTFSETVDSETGKKFYANLPRENMAVLRGLSNNEQNRILQDGIKEKSVGANLFVTGKDGNSSLSGYEDNVYSAYIGFGKKLNSNWSMGTTFTAGYVDSSYDDINSEKENKILMAFMPILYKNNNFKYLATPQIGFGLGSYTRYANSGEYEADTFDIYYGLTNHVEYSVDVKVAELVYEAELNLLGVQSNDAKEQGGLMLTSSNTMSLEAGVGLKLRKNIKLDKNRSLMLAVGSKYYKELLDPYDSLDITMKGSPVSFSHKGYSEDDKRIKTTLEAVYQDGGMNIGAEISHNKEKESSVEGAIGVRYNF